MFDSNPGRRSKAGFGLAALIAVTFGVLIAVPAWLDERDYHAEANQYADDYVNTARVECEIVNEVAGAPADDCQESSESKARPDQRYEYDLEAQRTMSTWTRAMGIAAIIGMCVGIFGLGLLYVTFQATWRAATASQRTYEAFVAAEDASLVLEFSHGNIVEAVSQGVRQPDSYFFQFKIANIGRSTARIQSWEIEGADRNEINQTLNAGETTQQSENFSTNEPPAPFTLTVYYSTPLRQHLVLDFRVAQRLETKVNGVRIVIADIKSSSFREVA